MIKLALLAASLLVASAAAAPLVQQDSCLTFSVEGDCLVCQAGFYLDTTSKSCLQQNIPGCLEYVPNKNDCAIFADQLATPRVLQAACDSLFYPGGNGCVAITVTNCASSSGNDNACLVCNVGYYFSSPTLCKISNVLNCDTYQSNLNLCDTCIDGWVQINGACFVTNNVHCLDFNAATNSCLLCESLLFLSLGKCLVVTKTNCLSSNGIVNLCDVCADGFFLDPSGNCIQQRLSNCAAYQSQVNVCTECVAGYVLITGSCQVSKDVNCQTFDVATNACTTCNNLYYINSGSCLPLVKKNCDVSLGIANACFQCSIGYYPAPSSPADCIKINNPNCDAVNYNTNECASCQSGYTPDSGRCRHPNYFNCASFSTIDQSCKKCNSLFYINPTKGCTAISSTNCVSSVGFVDSCGVCDPTYFVNNAGLCVLQAIDNCVTYVPQQNLCTVCESLFYPSNDQTSCVAFTDIHCTASDGTDNVCTTCADHYVHLAGTGCYPRPSFCKTYNADPFLCDECDEGYNKVNNLCEPITVTANCLIQGTGRCVFCAEGLFDIGSGCTDVIPNCAEYVFEFGYPVCRKCVPNFYFVIGDYNSQLSMGCYPLSYLNAGVHPASLVAAPTRCSAGYYLNGAVCQALPSGCYWGNGVTNACILCKPGFYLSGTNCLAISADANCLTQNINSNTCSSCAAGRLISVTSGKCVLANAITNCVELDPIKYKCKFCASGYAPSASGVSCTAATSANCRNSASFVSASKTCTLCKNTWYLNNNNCYPILSECKTSDGINNVCAEACQANEYKNPSTNLCVARNNPNCDTFELFTNNCVTCATNFYLTASKTCAASNIENCAIYVPNFNLCHACTLESNLYSFHGVCDFKAFCGYISEQNSAGPDQMECGSCTKGYIFNAAGNCVPAVRPFWIYNGVTPTYCDRLYVGTANNPANPDSTTHCQALNIPNCIYNILNSSNCVACASNFYLDSNACPAATVTNCAKLNFNTNKCFECNAGYYLGPANECIEQDFRLCLTFIPNTNFCATCDSNITELSSFC